jgi:Ca-activated chloride channel family protein
MSFTQRHIALTRCLALTLALSAALLSTLHAARARQIPNTSAQDKPAAAPSNDTTTASDLVFVNVAVTDPYGRFMTGLSREAFSIFEGKNQPELLYFSDKEVPQSVGIVFDVSKSMGTVALDFARGAVVRFARQANKSNEYFLIGFDAQPRLLADWTRDEKGLIVGLNKLGHIEQKKTKYGTSLYDSVAAAIEKVVRGPQPRHTLLVVSDGQDNESETNLSRLREMLKQSDVIVYAVGIGLKPDEDYEGSEKLKELVAVSGGKAYFPTTEAELDDTFERIGLELHNSYTLGFRPKAADGKWHDFKVKVQPPPKFPRLYVRARRLLRAFVFGIEVGGASAPEPEGTATTFASRELQGRGSYSMILDASPRNE